MALQVSGPYKQTELVNDYVVSRARDFSIQLCDIELFTTKSRQASLEYYHKILKNVKNPTFLAVLKGALPFAALIELSGNKVSYAEVHSRQTHEHYPELYEMKLGEFDYRINAKVHPTFIYEDQNSLVAFFNPIPKGKDVVIVEDGLSVGTSTKNLVGILQKRQNKISIAPFRDSGHFVDGVII